MPKKIVKRVENRVIVDEARRLFEAAFAEDADDHKRHCLYWAASVVFAAHTFGRVLKIQAGSASWLRIRPEEDDGVMATHFSYEWQGADPAPYLAAGILPEMHVWAADVAKREIVDLTVGTLPDVCEETAGLPWTAPKPPLFLWAAQKQIPNGWHYAPNMEAIGLALALIRAQRVVEKLGSVR